MSLEQINDTVGADPARILEAGLEHLNQLREAYRRATEAVSEVEGMWAAEIARASQAADEIRDQAKNEAGRIMAAGKAETDEISAEAKAETDEIMASAKHQADEIKAAAKAEADTLIDAAKRDIDAIDAVAKDKTSAVLRQAKDEARSITASAKAEANRISDEVKAQRTAGVHEALRGAEPARMAYADGVAQMVATGWATLASLSSLGHATPRRPKSLGSE